jgi:hypothetical protein
MGGFESCRGHAGTGSYLFILFIGRLQNNATSETSGWSYEAFINVTS